MILFFASRYILVKDLIVPNLEEGKVVLSDRLYPSTGAFQGYGEGVNMENILKTAKVVFGKYKPDAVVLFDTTVETAKRRLEGYKGSDPFDKMSLDYFERVSEGYREMANENWGGLNWYTIDGEPSIAEVTESVARLLKDILDPHIFR